MIYQDSGAFVAGPSPLRPAPSTGNAPIEPGTSLYVHGYSGGAQTRWLEETLSAAADRRQHRLDHRADASGCTELFEERQRL